MSDELVFVDTNVLVYAYDVDAAAKHDTAQSVLSELWVSRTGVVSSQVLQEFYVTVTRKLPKPLARPSAREVLSTYRAWPLHRPDADDVIGASELEERHRLSFWDSLVVISAQRLGAGTVFSEDLNAGQRFGGVTVVNPFLAPSTRS